MSEIYLIYLAIKKVNFFMGHPVSSGILQTYLRQISGISQIHLSHIWRKYQKKSQVYPRNISNISQASIRHIQANIKQIKVKYLLNLRHSSGKFQPYLRPISNISPVYVSHIFYLISYGQTDCDQYCLKRW